jgi:hypothetical protein
MAGKTYYRKGSYNVVCDSCGFKFKADELRLRWDGFFVCGPCWNPRQPQDLIRPPKEDLSLPFTRPEPPEDFINVCTLKGIQALSGWAIAGCALAGYTVEAPPVPPPDFCWVEGRQSISGIGVSGCIRSGFTIGQ